VLRLVHEGQVRRDDVVLIAPPCRGVAEDGVLAAKCHACAGGHAPGCDYGVTAEGVQRGEIVGSGDREVRPDPRDAQIAQLEELTAEQRWRFWHRQFARCLRCYACRAVCPGCYCPVCVARRHQPQWIPTAIDGRGNTVWNIVRALHMAGRCVGCDECARVCPAHIRLDLLHRKLNVELERQFGAEMGEDGLVISPLTEFRMDDPAEFIR
jgi:heterodisulfide reductase subunit C